MVIFISSDSFQTLLRQLEFLAGVHVEAKSTDGLEVVEGDSQELVDSLSSVFLLCFRFYVQITRLQVFPETDLVDFLGQAPLH